MRPHALQESVTCVSHACTRAPREDLRSARPPLHASCSTMRYASGSACCWDRYFSRKRWPAGCAWLPTSSPACWPSSSVRATRTRCRYPSTGTRRRSRCPYVRHPLPALRVSLSPPPTADLARLLLLTASQPSIAGGSYPVQAAGPPVLPHASPERGPGAQTRVGGAVPQPGQGCAAVVHGGRHRRRPAPQLLARPQERPPLPRSRWL